MVSSVKRFNKDFLFGPKAGSFMFDPKPKLKNGFLGELRSNQGRE